MIDPTVMAIKLFLTCLGTSLEEDAVEELAMRPENRPENPLMTVMVKS